jgi:hypothetical protein
MLFMSLTSLLLLVACVTAAAYITTVGYTPAVGGIAAIAGVPLIPDFLSAGVPGVVGLMLFIACVPAGN